MRALGKHTNSVAIRCQTCPLQGMEYLEFELRPIGEKDMDESSQKNEADVQAANHRIVAVVIAKLNLADFQNAVPMLRELSIASDSAEEAKELELSIESTPAFLKPKRWHIDAIGAGKLYHLTDLDVQLDGALLSRLTEAEKATVSFVLRGRGEACTELTRLERVVELLPRNQWGGLSHLPDMVAAFVQPNEPAVERLLK